MVTAIHAPTRFPGVWRTLTFAVLCGASLTAPAAGGGSPVVYAEVGAERGIGPYTNALGMAAGAAIADYDDDGDLDIFVPTGLGTPDLLYRSRGDGSFEEVAAAVGLASEENHRGALWLDYDGDGRRDLLVVGDDHVLTTDFIASNLRLYHQGGDGRFTDVTEAAGLFGRVHPPGTDPDMHSGGLAAGDVDNDGFLDVRRRLRRHHRCLGGQPARRHLLATGHR